jgi:Kdo2-lipid IVA lauroyltransferase/acyltransferase
MLTTRREKWRTTRRGLILSVAGVLARLPRGTSRLIGRFAGMIAWHIMRVERGLAVDRAQDKLGLTRSQAETLIQRNLVTLGRTIADAVRLRTMSRHELNRLVRFEGVKHFHDALSEGRGALLLSAHVGNWEVLSAALCLAGIPLNVVARRPDDAVLADNLEQLRGRWGAHTIWRDRGMLPVMRALRRNEVVAVLIDQATDVPGAYLPFLGVPAFTPTGPARLALRTGVPVIPAHIRETDDGYVAVVEPRFECKTVDEHDLTEAWNEMIGSWIREAPESWVWIHDRWARKAWTRVTRAAVVAVMTVMCVGCQEIEPEPEAPVFGGEPEQTIAGTRIVWSEGARTSALIRANTLRRYPKRDEVLLEGDVRIALFDEKGRKSAIVTGQRGKINDRTRTAFVDSGLVVRFLGSNEYAAATVRSDWAKAEDLTKIVTAMGNVSVVSDSGITLRTEYLTWSGRLGKIRAPRAVTITTATEIESGFNLWANADLTEYTMERVTGRTRRPAGDIKRIREQSRGTDR